MTTACPTCGFEGGRLSPIDAVAALRSFPRRFAELADGQPRDEPDEDNGPTPSDELVAATRARVTAEATSAAGEVAQAGAWLRRVLVEDNPGLDRGVTHHVSGDGLAALTSAVASVADLAEATSGDAWTRTGTRAGNPVTAVDLLREAVHAGAHHLRAAGH